MFNWVRGLWKRYTDWYCRPSWTEQNEIRVLKDEIRTLEQEISIWDYWYRSEKLDEPGMWVNFQQALKTIGGGTKPQGKPVAYDTPVLEEIWRDQNAGLRLSLSEMQPEGGLPTTGYPLCTEALQAGDAEDLHSTKRSVQRRRVHKKYERVRQSKKTRSRRESSSRLRRSV